MDYQIDKSSISEVTLEGQAEKRPTMADRLYSNTHVVDTTEEKARERTEAYLPCSWDRVQGLRREKGGQSSSINHMIPRTVSGVSLFFDMS